MGGNVTCNPGNVGKAYEQQQELQPSIDDSAKLVTPSGQMAADPKLEGMRKSTRVKRRSTKLEGYAYDGMMRVV